MIFRVHLCKTDPRVFGMPRPPQFEELECDAPFAHAAAITAAATVIIEGIDTGELEPGDELFALVTDVETVKQDVVQVRVPEGAELRELLKMVALAENVDPTKVKNPDDYIVVRKPSE